ncbi:hypothetical protein, partial [Haloarcula marismortui]|uniref:hypothetical protein n=1 Tax=Haloarcula marismortui TaxID=2238 RepID=UPI0019D3A69D
KKLNGSTGEEAIGRSVKSGVEFVYSVIAVLPWIGFTGVIAAVSGLSAGVLRFSVIPGSVELDQVGSVALAGILTVLLGYRKYSKQIHCEYP